MVRLRLTMGRRSGMRPADLVGALTRGFHIDGRAIGGIDIGGNTTHFDVARDVARRVLDASGRMLLRGQRVRIEPADDAGPARPPRRDAPLRKPRRPGARGRQMVAG